MLIAGQCEIKISDSDDDYKELSVFLLDLDEGTASLVSTAPMELLKDIPSLRSNGPYFGSFGSYCGHMFSLQSNSPCFGSFGPYSEAAGLYWGSAPCQSDCISIGDGIYIGAVFPSVVYNVATQKWFLSYLGETLGKSEYHCDWRWAPITYQPGLNPWLGV